MARRKTPLCTRRENASVEARIAFSSSGSFFVEDETRLRYAEHLAACQKFGIKPSSWQWFAQQIADEMRRGVYSRPERLTPESDAGCKRLLREVVVVTGQRRRLRAWHEQYVRTCREQGLRAYTLHLILDTFRDCDVRMPRSLAQQAAAINERVEAYCQKANRKENPQWYVRPLKNKDKTDKYAD